MKSLREFANSRLFEVTCDIKHKKPVTLINFTLTGPLTGVLFEEDTGQSKLTLATKLWQKSCFECFFFEKNSEAYFELNFSSTYEYELLSFKSYRAKEAELDARFSLKKLKFKTDAESLTCEAHICLPSQKSYTCCPTLILKERSSATLFYALEHGPEADFHRREVIEALGFPLKT